MTILVNYDDKNSRQQLHGAYYVTGTILIILYVLIHLIPNPMG